MCETAEIARNLVFALRKIEADADGALEHGNAKAALHAIRDVSGRPPARHDGARRPVTLGGGRVRAAKQEQAWG